MRENMSQPIITKNNNFSTVCSFYWKLINDYKKKGKSKAKSTGQKDKQPSDDKVQGKSKMQRKSTRKTDKTKTT